MPSKKNNKEIEGRGVKEVGRALRTVQKALITFFSY